MKQTMHRHLFLPDEALDELESFFNLPTKILLEIFDVIKDGIYDIDEMTIDLINRGISDNIALNSIAIICYLNAIAEDNDLSSDEIINELEYRLKNSKMKSKKASELIITLRKKEDTIKKLFSTSVRQPYKNKKRELERGIYNSVLDIRTICDVRPIFNEERTQIYENVIIMLLDITVEDEKGDEKHIVVSMNSEKLEKLEEVVELARKKMRIMEKEFLKG